MYPIDGRDAWSEHQPSAQKENEYIRQHDYSEYARCHLGIDDEHDEDTKVGTSSPTATSNKSTAAGCSLRSHGPGNENTTT